MQVSLPVLHDDLEVALLSAWVDSFVFFLFSGMRNCTKQVTVSSSFDRFAKLEKLRKYEKSVSSCFAKLKKNVSYRSFAYLHLFFVLSLRISNLLFEFRTFYSRYVPFSIFNASFAKHEISQNKEHIFAKYETRFT